MQCDSIFVALPCTIYFHSSRLWVVLSVYGT